MKTKSPPPVVEDAYRTISSLARLLEKDRKTVLKYIKLADIDPLPEKRKGQRVYHLPTVAKAIYG